MARFGALLTAFILFVTPPALADRFAWEAQGWKTDFDIKSIKLTEILSGGPPKDGIPSIDNPKFIPVSSVNNLGEFEPVITLSINNDVRAYPLRVLTWHEIVNDVVGGVPVAVTYCPLCNAAIVFERTVDSEAVEFGTTGMLRKSDLVMYDRKSESWWQQFTGEAIVGTHTGQKLKMVPVRVEGFKTFATAYPDAKVLVPNNNRLRDYGRNPYAGYDSRSAPYPLYDGSLPTDISPMARVVVVREKADVSHIITMNKIREAGTYEMDNITLQWTSGVNSALDTSSINRGKDVGSIKVFKKEQGKEVELVHDVTFAFVAHAFHPEISIVQ